MEFIGLKLNFDRNRKGQVFTAAECNTWIIHTNNGESHAVAGPQIYSMAGQAGGSHKKQTR